MAKRIFPEREPCPLGVDVRAGQRAVLIYGVEEDDSVWAMCLRDFSCNGEECPLSGRTRKVWHKVSG
jgi:hypothetical protein